MSGDTTLYRSSANRMQMNNSLTIQSATNNASAFIVQTSAGGEVFKVDTENMGVAINGSINQTGTRLTLKYAVPGGAATNYMREMDIVGNYAYLMNQGATGSFSIMDISNPGAPAVTATLTDARFNGARDVRVAGRYAYIVTFYDYLIVVDIANASSPTIVGAVQDATYLNDAHGIEVQGSYAFVAADTPSTTGIFAVFDISDPTNPSYVTSLVHADFSLAKQVEINGRYAYVSSGTFSTPGGFTVVDIQNPRAPVKLGNVKSAAYLSAIRAIVFNGKYAYVTAENSDALTVINVSNPSSPAIVGSLTDAALDGAFDVTINGRYAYVAAREANGVAVVDISNPASPTLVAGAGYNTADLQPTVVVAKGRYLYVGTNRFSTSLTNFTILDTGGSTLSATTATTLDTEILQVQRSADITGTLNVGNALYVGQGGISTNGSLAVRGDALFRVGADTTEAFKIQSSDSTALLTADSTGKKVTIRSLDVAFNLTINGHIISGGSTPTIAAGAAARTSPTVTITGTDTAGKITITSGTGTCPATGSLATVTFAAAFGAAPKVTLTPANAAAAPIHTYVDDASTTTTAFRLSTVSGLSTSTQYVWHYQVIQ